MTLLVPESLEVGPQLNPAGFVTFIVFTSFFFKGFYNTKLPLKFLSSLDNSHRKGELYFVCQKASPNSLDFKYGRAGPCCSALLLCQKALLFTRLKYYFTNPTCAP